MRDNIDGVLDIESLFLPQSSKAKDIPGYPAIVIGKRGGAGCARYMFSAILFSIILFGAIFEHYGE